ncbi:hypothetical protein BGW80DRAFT_1313061 [Lactifluus volemus]|nr:hypothetical protein BGW80DRAFT_1313061 [Lactifluus volemus]
MSLIRGALQQGIKLSGVNVDALVMTKADSKYKIVGAANVAAKVFEEDPHGHDDPEMCEGTEAPCVKRTWSSGLGSDYPSDPNTKTWVKDSLERMFG